MMDNPVSNNAILNTFVLHTGHSLSLYPYFLSVFKNINVQKTVKLQTGTMRIYL